jgi:hypothetical protein
MGCFFNSNQGITASLDESKCKCTFFAGSADYRQPAKVVMTTADASTADTISFAIAGVKNPNWTGNEDGASPFMRVVIENNTVN